MAYLKILTDSCSDLDGQVRKDLGIDYVQMHICYNGIEEPASLDWEIHSPREIYDIMRNGIRITTTQVPAAAFAEYFEEQLKLGNDVLYVGCSSGLSGSVNTAQVVAAELMEKYPDNKIYVCDPLNSSLGEGLIVMEAAKMRNDGKSAQEIADYIEKNRLCYLQFCAVDDLVYLKRAGRIKASKAFFGNLFGVKPILISNRAGENFAMKKAKGRKGSLDELVSLAKENIVDAANQTVAVVHADCIEDAEYLVSRVREEIAPKDVYVNYIGPIIGASAGPKTVAIYCKGKEVEI